MSYLLIEIPTYLSSERKYGIYPFYVDVSNLNEAAINELVTTITMEAILLPNIDLWPTNIARKWSTKGWISLSDFKKISSIIYDEITYLMENTDKIYNARLIDTKTEYPFAYLFDDMDEFNIESAKQLRESIFGDVEFNLSPKDVMKIEINISGGKRLSRTPDKFYRRKPHHPTISGGAMPIPDDDPDFYSDVDDNDAEMSVSDLDMSDSDSDSMSDTSSSTSSDTSSDSSNSSNMIAGSGYGADEMAIDTGDSIDNTTDDVPTNMTGAGQEEEYVEYTEDIMPSGNPYYTEGAAVSFLSDDNNIDYDDFV